MAENNGGDGGNIGLLDILLLPLLWPMQGTVWIAKQVKKHAESELYDEDGVRRQLTELELRYDLEEISEEEYLATEEALLERMRAIQRRRAAESRM